MAELVSSILQRLAGFPIAIGIQSDTIIFLASGKDYHLKTLARGELI